MIIVIRLLVRMMMMGMESELQRRGPRRLYRSDEHPQSIPVH